MKGLIEPSREIEVLDATALGRRLGFRRDTVLAYLSRRNFRRIPRPYRQLAMGPIWYEKQRPTFSDALGLVRKELWAQEATFYGSPGEIDTVKVPRGFVERLTDVVCYAARWLKSPYSIS